MRLALRAVPAAACSQYPQLPTAVAAHFGRPSPTPSPKPDPRKTCSSGTLTPFLPGWSIRNCLNDSGPCCSRGGGLGGALDAHNRHHPAVRVPRRVKQGMQTDFRPCPATACAACWHEAWYITANMRPQGKRVGSSLFETLLKIWLVKVEEIRAAQGECACICACEKQESCLG